MRSSRHDDVERPPLPERRLIEEILGERYEPHMSERSPDAREEDPSTIEARKRADALGRSRHQWS